jgi:ubiquitin carboxyl-terminal hydrolase 3
MKDAVELFTGTLHSEVTCLRCSTIFRKDDTFQDLSLEISSHSIFLTRNSVSSFTPRPCNIRDCMRKFCAAETLGQTSLYRCTKCASDTDAVKRLRLRDLPDVLCLHLKRFRWTTRLHGKVVTRITFPLRSFDIAPFCVDHTQSTVFDLASVVRHHGSGLAFGHYTAYGLNTETNTWLHFDDVNVSAVSPEEVERAQPYILIYVKRQARH